MPEFIITDPQGRKVKLTGDSPPTEQELEEIFQQIGPSPDEIEIPDRGQEAHTEISPESAPIATQEQQPAPPTLDPFAIAAGEPELSEFEQKPSLTPSERTIETMLPIPTSMAEAAATITTGVPATILGGLTGLITAPFQGAKQAERNIKTVQEALTFLPRTEQGMKRLRQIAQMLQPVSETVEAVEKGIGGAAFEATGEPLAGALGEATPTAIISALGLAPTRNVLGGAKFKEAMKAKITPSTKKLLRKSAPTIEGIKQTARNIYNELDNLGITVNPDRVNRLREELTSIINKEGFKRNPKVRAALKTFDDIGPSPTVTQIDTLRKATRNIAQSLEPSESRIGSIMIDKIDDMLDTLKPEQLKGAKKTDIGAKFKDARQLWARAKRAEILEDIFDKAGRQATGFENGLRTQFRALLNNKKKRRGFSQEELKAMDLIVKGDTAQNIAKALGKFGFGEGQATSMLLSSLGIAGGAVVGGAPGAVTIPLIGQLSRNLAQKLTRLKAEKVDLLVRAGTKGEEIVKAYMKAIPRKDWNTSELTELLTRPGVSLDKLKPKIPKLGRQNKTIGDAAFFAAFIQSQKENQ